MCGIAGLISLDPSRHVAAMLAILGTAAPEEAGPLTSEVIGEEGLACAAGIYGSPSSKQQRRHHQLISADCR